ncbi:MAG: hypothetical protein DRP66_06420 [Planctomycetota bacterium]|nr:MAG: hypothetical protein DRP66_06420 [Planctomycetota bacterium]
MAFVKRVMLAGLFIVPVLLVQSAWAGLDFLPTSTHYQGSTSKSVSGMEGLVQVNFAVYDALGGNEFAASGDGRFTYVYQVFNEIADDDFSIDLFRVFEIDPAAISGNDQISSEDDLAGGIGTTAEYFNSSLTDGIWEFEGGALIKGKHSWFLTISSDYDWVKGDFSIYAPEPDDDLPVPEVPEPATMILLGIGSAVLAARRKGSVGISR